MLPTPVPQEVFVEEPEPNDFEYHENEFETFNVKDRSWKKLSGTFRGFASKDEIIKMNEMVAMITTPPTKIFCTLKETNSSRITKLQKSSRKSDKENESIQFVSEKKSTYSQKKQCRRSSKIEFKKSKYDNFDDYCKHKLRYVDLENK